MYGERRSIGKMPYKRRQSGLSSLERRKEYNLWSEALLLLNFLVAIEHLPGINDIFIGVIALVTTIIGEANAMRSTIWNNHININRDNSNRGVQSFSDEDCWRLFRFRKIDLPLLIANLSIPLVLKIIGDKNGYVNGDYAALYLFHRLRYPGILADCSIEWGRDYSQLSKIFNTVLNFLYDMHRNKVIGNIAWYQDRFDGYNHAITMKLAASNLLPVPGEIPANLENIFGFIDCTANEMCRPGGPNEIQNAFWNGYHHGHYIIWQDLIVKYL